ncbi:hypothetical protein NDU88_005822 [Pleurodeles waltl]|uniref:Uncharacterized protein n=1 Tax=Pleurodeles waltl TaxID=8319 RepID=A0AAV7LME1_PLEWA|nr:hypothetical protein NDU88_005822 [Pleurodeles waltl]
MNLCSSISLTDVITAIESCPARKARACDGPVGDSPCTKPTGADTAPGAVEQPGAGTNESFFSPVMSWRRAGNTEGGGEKMPASESGKEASCEEASSEEESGVEESGEEESG